MWANSAQPITPFGISKQSHMNIHSSMNSYEHFKSYFMARIIKKDFPKKNETNLDLISVGYTLNKSIDITFTCHDTNKVCSLKMELNKDEARHIRNAIDDNIQFLKE
jgi:hypothetical protein